MELDSLEASKVYRRLAYFLRADAMRLEACFPNDDEMLVRASHLSQEADELDYEANRLWEAKTNLRG